jgi:hypothetical protein
MRSPGLAVGISVIAGRATICSSRVEVAVPCVVQRELKLPHHISALSSGCPPWRAGSGRLDLGRHPTLGLHPAGLSVACRASSRVGETLPLME